ncbi:uncharacterized protein PgNI_02198 [Pyricularia grisea]|uniref:Chromo domain-containing protein n=1 Tax=Pyricularia grisea TaxID=148305 RepID=A0A6P8BJW6_PYRGI|nr:uncharacterized protein PgNI_02198 [Pyricularia grisea]TLD16965.1 hypothetical protein PgNI_02198 [Pyricularia grisea]
MDSDIEASAFRPAIGNRTNLKTVSSIKDSVRKQWAKCREVQEILCQIEIRDVVCALGINELQAAELQGCIFTLLATGPTSLCFAAERMVIRLSKERWPDLLCWDEVPSIWLTEAMHECVELVKRGGDLVKEVRDLKEQSDGDQVPEKTARTVSADQRVANQQQKDMDLEESIEIPSVTVSGHKQTDPCLNSPSKDPEQTAEDRNDNSGDEFFETMLGLDDTSTSHPALELQCHKPKSVVIATPTKQSNGQEPLISSAETISGHNGNNDISPLQSSSPGLFVTPERDHRTNGSATEVSIQFSLDVDMTTSEGGDEKLDEVNPKKESKLSSDGKQAKVILDCKLDQDLNRQMYLVRWTGYPETGDSWELVEHLTEYIGLVVEYNKQQSIRKSHSIKHGTVDAAKTDAHTDTETASSKTSSKVIPANHVLLRMMGRSSHSNIQRKRPETTTGAGEGTMSSSQASSPLSGDGREPVVDPNLPDTEESSAQPEEGPHGTKTAAAKSTEPAMPIPTSTYSQSRLLPRSSPLAPRTTTSPLAEDEISSTKWNECDRSTSPTPLDAPLHKQRPPAFPMVGPGWKKFAKPNLARSQSPSSSPALADLRGSTPSSGDVEVDGAGHINETYAAPPNPVRHAGTGRVLRGSSERNPQDKAESGPFKHIKFVKNVKNAAPGHDKAQLGERSSYKQPSLLRNSSTRSPVMTSKTTCQPTSQKTKPSNMMEPKEYGADELPDKPQKAPSTAIHKMVKPVPTLQKPQSQTRRKLVNLKTGEVTYLDEQRKPDAQANRSTNAALTTPPGGTKLHAAIDRRAATNPPAQRLSIQGMDQAGAKRKRSGDDLPAAMHAAKRTNLFGP